MNCSMYQNLDRVNFLLFFVVTEILVLYLLTDKLVTHLDMISFN
jgi:hypothetical protein